MKYSQLIEKCINLIDTFDQNKMTPDSHAEQYLSALKCQDTERVFMKQIFYGCERYRGFLKVSNNFIFSKFSGSTNRKNDGTFFAIFTYLICFRMDQLPFKEFKKIILSQDQVKMNVLFTFIFDFDMLRQEVFDQWQHQLEMDYLEGKLITKLIERKQKCDQLIGKVNENATGKKFEGQMTGSQQNIEDIKDRKRTTVVQEFNLTKPKPKMIPQVEKIQVGFKANPVKKTKKDLNMIEQQKKSRRKQIQDNIRKNYEQNKSKQQFEFQTSKRPTNLPKIKEQVQQQITKELKKKVAARPVPKFNDVDIKLNVAAILRQEKKLKEKIDEEEKRMKDLEMNMRDESEHQNWKKEMKEKDKYEQMELQMRRKIQMELARQAAMQACEDKIEEKKNLVEDMKQIAIELKAERQKLQNQELESKKKLVEQMQQIQENIKVEQEKVLQQNKKIHDEQKQERRRIQEKKKQEQRVEMLKRKDLIAEIRELQKKIRARPKQEIEYVSIGLLEQMTLDQLQERLSDVKRQRKEQQERRRESNNKKKQQFNNSISQKKDSIMAARNQLAKQKEEERRKKKEQADAEKQRLAQAKAKSMMEYKKKEQKKIEQRKSEKEKLAKEIKETEQRRMFLMQGQAQQEANAFKNLQKGEEREILDRQNTKLMEEYKKQTIKEGEMRILADKNKRQVQKKIEFNKLYNEQEEVNNRLAEELMQEDVANKAVKYQQVKTFEHKHNQNMVKSNPYKTKIAEMSLSKSKGITKK